MRICIYYVAAKATYIRLLHGKIGFLGVFSALAPCIHTLKIWGAGVYSPRSYGAEFVFFVFLSFCSFVCPSRYDARHRKPRMVQNGPI